MTTSQINSQNTLTTDLANSDTTIFLNESKVRALIVTELKLAHKFEWTGWRIPFYLELNDEMESGKEIQAELSCGGWLSNSSWQPNAIEVFKVERWELVYELDDTMDMDEEIDFAIDDILDDYDWQNDIERNISEHFNNRYNAEFIVNVEWN